MRTLFALSIALLASSAYAQETLPLETRTVCQAQCLVVDNAASAVRNLGSVTGDSARDLLEAFRDLTQNCQNAATARGENPQLAVAVYSIAYRNYDASSYSSGSWSESTDFSFFGTGFRYSRWGRSASGYMFGGVYSHEASGSYSSGSSEHEFSVSLKTANVRESCLSYTHNPNVPPKYIGPGKPLG